MLAQMALMIFMAFSPLSNLEIVHREHLHAES